MSYCKKCGAYIPDGKTKCLACGFDESASENSAYQTQSSPSDNTSFPHRIDTNKLKQEMEERRNKQKEYARKWAEAERNRRQQAREAQEKESQGDAESSREKNNSESALPWNLKDVLPNKVFAAMSYFSVLFAVPYIFCRDDDFAMFHAKQGLILFVVSRLAKIIGRIIGLGWLAGILNVVFIITGVCAAADGEKKYLPYIGKLF